MNVLGAAVMMFGVSSESGVHLILFAIGLSIFGFCLFAEKVNTIRNKKWCEHFGLRYVEGMKWGLLCVVWWGVDENDNWYTRGADGFPYLVRKGRLVKEK